MIMIFDKKKKPLSSYLNVTYMKMEDDGLFLNFDWREREEKKKRFRYRMRDEVELIEAKNRHRLDETGFFQTSIYDERF